MDGTCSTYAGNEKCTQDFFSKTERNGLLGRLKHRWKHNDKMNLKGTGWDDMDWFQDREKCQTVVNTVMKLPV